MIVKETIQVEQLPEERSFLVKRYIEDKMTAEQFAANYKQVEDAIDGLNKQKEDLPTQIAKATEYVEKQLTELAPRKDGLESGIKQAKLWMELTKQENARAGNDNKQDI